MPHVPVSGPDHTELKVATLVRAYQMRGHLLANLDPLGIARHGIDRGLVSEKEFELDAFELTKDDLKRRVNVRYDDNADRKKFSKNFL